MDVLLRQLVTLGEGLLLMTYHHLVDICLIRRNLAMV